LHFPQENEKRYKNVTAHGILEICQCFDKSKILPLIGRHPTVFFSQSQSPRTETKHSREPKSQKLAWSTESTDIYWLNMS